LLASRRIKRLFYMDRLPGLSFKYIRTNTPTYCIMVDFWLNGKKEKGYVIGIS
jgi:hypothetical protein